jgi:hypothetical protein
MPDKTIESLKEAFMKDKENIPDDCEMADKVTAFAFGELNAEESQKIREHMHTCRYCLDMYMDIRMAEQEATEEKSESVEVLPGLEKAINRGKTPEPPLVSIMAPAISKFFSGGFVPKPIVAFASIVLVCAAGFYIYSRTMVTPYTIAVTMHGRTQIGFRGDQPEYKDFQVQPGGVVKSEDYFKFETTIDKNAYLYVIFLNSSREIESMEKGLVTAGTVVYLPDNENWFQLDKNAGTEKLYLVASKKKIDDFGGRIEKLKTDGIGTIDKVFPKTTIKPFGFEHQ